MRRLLQIMALLVVAGAPSAWAQDVPKGDAANGKKVYLADGCYQ